MESTATTTESTTPATAAATMAATATVASAATAAAAARHLHVTGCAVFPVEQVECRKTHVRHFLFAEDEALIGRSVQSLWNVDGRKSGGRCASHH
jgi:hypothetical protein